MRPDLIVARKARADKDEAPISEKEPEKQADQDPEFSAGGGLVGSTSA